MLANILFTLPTLSPNHSKFPRTLAILQALDRSRFQPIVAVNHERRLHKEGVRLLRELDVPIQLMRMEPHRQEVLRSLLEMSKIPSRLRNANILIQHSANYTQWWSEPLLAYMGGVRYWILTKANSAVEGPHWRIRLQLAKRIVVEVPQVAELLKQTIPQIESKLVLIPKGVDTTMFRPKEPNISLRKELGLKSDDIVLGCVAHLTSIKDHPSLLQALKVTNISKIKLLLIGSHSDVAYTQYIKREVCKLELDTQVHFLGERSDISNLHSIMDGIVLCSKHEASPTAILEGMSSGLPIICSDVGGLPFIVKDRVNGWIIPRGADFVQGLGAAISSWATDRKLRKAFGDVSRQIVETSYTLNQMTQGYINLYEQLITENKY